MSRSVDTEPRSLKYLHLDQLVERNKNFFRDKTVFLRVDTNSTIVNGEIKTNARVVAAARAIRLLAKTYRAKVIVGTHNGRRGDLSYVSTGFCLRNIRKAVIGEIQYIGNTFTGDHLNDETIRAIKHLKGGEALLLENLRFLDGEEQKLDPEEHAETQFITDLIEKCGVEYYVLDAFSIAHRLHRSVVGFVNIPNIAGPELHRELDAINELKRRFLNTETANSIFILGGKKIQDYFSLIEKSLRNKKVSKILTGGLLANLGLFARGYDLGTETKRLLLRRDSNGKSAWDYLPKIRELLNKYPDVLMLPIDVAGGDGSSRIVHKVDQVPPEFCVYDIGDQTVGLYQETIKQVVHQNSIGGEVMVYIKGPVGAYDFSKEYNLGSSQLLALIRDPNLQEKIYVVMGGGDTTSMLREFAISETSLQHKHISLAGGALIKMLADEVLPGIQSLEDSYAKFHSELGIET